MLGSLCTDLVDVIGTPAKRRSLALRPNDSSSGSRTISSRSRVHTSGNASATNCRLRTLVPNELCGHASSADAPSTHLWLNRAHCTAPGAR